MTATLSARSPEEIMAECSRNSIVAMHVADRDLALRLGWRQEDLERDPATPVRPHPGQRSCGSERLEAVVGGFESGPVVEHPDVLDEPREQPWLAIVSGTPFDNPRGPLSRFSVRLEASSPAYARDMWQGMKANDPALLGWLRSITKRHRLICSCSGEACHGAVVVRAWHWLHDRDRAHAQLMVQTQNPA